MYTFKYTVDFEQHTGGTLRKSPIDFIISSDETDCLDFYFNDFSVDWNGPQPISRGASTICFKIDPTKRIHIVANSKRAKKFLWVQDTTSHTMDTLLKGVFGEMLLATSIVPAERTLDDSGSHGNEPYVGYITHRSLTRSIVQSPAVYFKEAQNNIVVELEKYYKRLWNEDELVIFDFIGF